MQLRLAPSRSFGGSSCRESPTLTHRRPFDLIPGGGSTDLKGQVTKLQQAASIEVGRCLARYLLLTALGCAYLGHCSVSSVRDTFLPFNTVGSHADTCVHTQVAKITKQLQDADLFSMKLLIVQANEKLDAMLLKQKEANNRICCYNPSPNPSPNPNPSPSRYPSPIPNPSPNPNPSHNPRRARRLARVERTRRARRPR